MKRYDIKTITLRAWSAAALCAAALLAGCASESDSEGNGGQGGSGSQPRPTGYADPDGVIILNQGAPRMENGSVTFLAPDGSVVEHLYRTVNGTAVGNTSQDLWLCDGKYYLMSNNAEVPDLGSGEAGDGSIVIVDATTFRREKVFAFDELKFPRPEGSLDENEMIPAVTPLENIAVLDEHNVFFADGQGMYRLDAATGKMNIVKGTYAFGNQGNTIETTVGTRGMTVIGDHLYCVGGGFWSETKLLELTKDMDQVTRELPLKGEFTSGICRTGDHELLVATCGRSGSTKSYLTYVDTDSWSITLERPLNADISAEFMNSSGVTLAGDYLYFAAGTLTVSRVSLKSWEVEEYIHVADDAPEARYLTCNVVADPERQLLYVSVSNELGEAIVSDGNILVYDCSGEEPVLKNNLVNRGSYPVNIYPVSHFYR